MLRVLSLLLLLLLLVSHFTGHEANDFAQQALQAGVPMWEMGSEKVKENYVLAEASAEQVAYGSTLPEPHKSAAQKACRDAKVQSRHHS